MRSLVYTALSTDANLITLGLGPDSVLSGDVDTPDSRPFINLRWGLRSPGLRGTTADVQALAIWVHDQPNDYAQITTIIRRIRDLLESIEDEVDPNGGRVTMATWTGDSGDLVDRGHGTIVRTTNYQIIGRSEA